MAQVSSDVISPSMNVSSIQNRGKNQAQGVNGALLFATQNFWVYMSGFSGLLCCSICMFSEFSGFCQPRKPQKEQVLWAPLVAPVRTRKGFLKCPLIFVRKNLQFTKTRKLFFLTHK